MNLQFVEFFFDGQWLNNNFFVLLFCFGGFADIAFKN